MQTTTFTNFSRQAKNYLDAVEQGETVRITRRVIAVLPVSYRQTAIQNYPGRNQPCAWPYPEPNLVKRF